MTDEPLLTWLVVIVAALVVRASVAGARGVAVESPVVARVVLAGH